MLSLKKRQLIDENLLSFYESMDFKTIADYLQAKDCLPDFVIEKITAARTPTAARKILINEIKMRGNQAVDSFYLALHYAKQENLASLIKEGISDDILQTIENQPNSSTVMPLRKAPGPPPMPTPPMHTYNPMGIPMSSRPEGSAIISSAPVIHHADEDAGPISAAPQLRDLRKETVKLVPVQLKRAKAPVPVRSKIPARPQTSAQEAAKSTDEAYNDFMKELEDLI